MKEKDKYKFIQCYLVWNEEDDCAASKPLWSKESAQKFADDMNKVYGGGESDEIRN